MCDLALLNCVQLTFGTNKIKYKSIACAESSAFFNMVEAILLNWDFFVSALLKADF